MLKLYVKTHCPYCSKVLLELPGLVHESSHSESYRILYVDRDENLLRELKEIGGKDMAPFLVDETADVAMYESAAIVKYLRKKYGVSDR